MITSLKLQNLTNMGNIDNIDLSDDPGQEIVWVVAGQLDDKIPTLGDLEFKGAYGEVLGGYFDGDETRKDNYIHIWVINAGPTKSYNLKSLPAYQFKLYYDGIDKIIRLPSLFNQVLASKDMYYWYIDDEGNLYWGTRDHKKTNAYNLTGQEMTPTESFDLKHLAVKGSVSLNKSAYSGYHCFMEQYVKCRDRGRLPWKTPQERY